MFDLSGCLVCQTFVLNTDLFCGFCWERFTARIRADGPVSRGDPLPVQSLWRWNEFNDDLSRAMIMGLKGIGDPEIWNPFAVRMLENFLKPSKHAAFLPIPSKRVRRDDHAFGLATALHRLTGVPLLAETLRAQTVGPSQKTLKKRERRKIHFVKTKRLPAGIHEMILIDDVVTSGATLAAAKAALGRQDGVHAWCLMDRNLSVFS